MLAIFYIVGNFPVNIEQLKSFASGEAMLLAVDFSINADMPSGPLICWYQVD